jgi:hypothetical protein
MTAASRPQVVTLRSGDAVLVRQVRPADAPTLLAHLPSLGRVETESRGPVVTAASRSPNRPGLPGKTSWTCWSRRRAGKSSASRSCCAG